MISSWFEGNRLMVGLTYGLELLEIIRAAVICLY